MKSRRLMSAPRLRRHRSCSNQCFDRGWSGPLALHYERLADVRNGSIADIPAVQAMSALPPTATEKTDIHNNCFVPLGDIAAGLLYHLVGALLQGKRTSMSSGLSFNKIRRYACSGSWSVRLLQTLRFIGLAYTACQRQRSERPNMLSSVRRRNDRHPRASTAGSIARASALALPTFSTNSQIDATRPSFRLRDCKP